MHPNRYPATVYAKRGIIPVVHPLEISVKHVGQFHSEAVRREKVDGWFRFPVVLSVATSVPTLGDHRSRNLLRDVWGQRSTRPNVKIVEGWTKHHHDRAVGSLRIYEVGESGV